MMNERNILNEEGIIIPAGLDASEVVGMINDKVELVGDIVDFVERQEIRDEILENENNENVEEEVKMQNTMSLEEVIMNAYETGDEFQIMVNEGIAEKFIERYQTFEGETVGVDTNTYAEEDYKKFSMFLKKHKIDLNNLPKDTKLGVAAYKVLSYDIFPEDVLKVENIKIKEQVAFIEINYKGTIETDVLVFNHEVGYVTVMKCDGRLKDITKDKISDSAIRRATYPASADETLVYATSNTDDGLKEHLVGVVTTMLENENKKEGKEKDMKKTKKNKMDKKSVEEAIETVDKAVDKVKEKTEKVQTKMEQFKNKILKKSKENKTNEIKLNKGISEYGKILAKKVDVDSMTAEEFLKTKDVFVLRYLDNAVVRDVIVMDDVNNRPCYEFINVKNKLNVEKMKEDMTKVGEEKYVEFMANELYGHVRPAMRMMSANIFVKNYLK